MLVEIASTPGRYSFVHALMRTSLEQDLTATRRARLHRRIGEEIEQRHRDRLDPYLVDLVRHFAAAGPEEVDRAVAYGLQAAEQATARLAYKEAVDLIGAALAARERDDPVDDGDSVLRAEVLARLGELLCYGGDSEARVPAIVSEAVAMARLLRDASTAARA